MRRAQGIGQQGAQHARKVKRVQGLGQQGAQHTCREGGEGSGPSCNNNKSIYHSGPDWSPDNARQRQQKRRDAMNLAAYAMEVGKDAERQRRRRAQMTEQERSDENMQVGHLHMLQRHSLAAAFSS